jgi:hypothetical protein
MSLLHDAFSFASTGDVPEDLTQDAIAIANAAEAPDAEHALCDVTGQCPAAPATTAAGAKPAAATQPASKPATTPAAAGSGSVLGYVIGATLAALGIVGAALASRRKAKGDRS